MHVIFSVSVAYLQDKTISISLSSAPLVISTQRVYVLMLSSISTSSGDSKVTSTTTGLIIVRTGGDEIREKGCI